MGMSSFYRPAWLGRDCGAQSAARSLEVSLANAIVVGNGKDEDYEDKVEKSKHEDTEEKTEYEDSREEAGEHDRGGGDGA